MTNLPGVVRDGFEFKFSDAPGLTKSMHVAVADLKLDRLLVVVPGSFFEGWAVMEAVKVFATRGRRPPHYFWRANDGLEVDLLIEAGGRTHAVEIKQTSTPMPGHARGLQRFQQLVGAKLAGELLLVCHVAERTLLPGGVQAFPWQDFTAWAMALATGG